MPKPILLDTGPLGAVSHPRAAIENRAIAEWLQSQIAAGVMVYLPEISDYELRRELLREGLMKSIERLDALAQKLKYLPLSTPIIRRAAELWALARKQGKPTADDKALDGDVILAAQAEEVGGIVATMNVGHLSIFIDARPWQDIQPPV